MMETDDFRRQAPKPPSIVCIAPVMNPASGNASGYDALSVADLTQAIGINPPSFYAAFGSKAGLYAEALRRYEIREGLDVVTALAPGIPLSRGVTSLLQLAADSYGSGSSRGCMVIEGARTAVDPEAGGQARAMLDASRTFIHARLVDLDADHADLAVDYVMMSLSGLSGSARNGVKLDRLRVLAAMAAEGLSQHLRT